MVGTAKDRPYHSPLISGEGLMLRMRLFLHAGLGLTLDIQRLFLEAMFHHTASIRSGAV